MDLLALFDDQINDENIIDEETYHQKYNIDDNKYDYFGNELQIGNHELFALFYEPVNDRTTEIETIEIKVGTVSLQSFDIIKDNYHYNGMKQGYPSFKNNDLP